MCRANNFGRETKEKFRACLPYTHTEVDSWQKNVANVTIDDYVAAIPHVAVVIYNMDDDKRM
jgi:hypothetical protein